MKKKARLLHALTLISSILLAGNAFAAVPKGAVLLPADKLFITSVSGASVTCGQLSTNWLAGTLTGPQKAYFLSDSANLKNLKLSTRSAAAGKKKKILAAIQKLQSKIAARKALCSGGPPTAPTATATPTPQASGNFDSSGNVTSAGKIVFGIPSALSANITAGKNTFNLNCTGCHGEKRNFSFPYIRQRIAQSPMFIDSNQIPDSSLADITAYLNRFNF